MPNSPNISVKMAVQSAYRYLQSIQDLMGSALEDIRLEEVELAEDQKTWLVTLSYDVKVKRRSALDEMVGSSSVLRFQREYKIFAINASTEEVEAMKIKPRLS